MTLSRLLFLATPLWLGCASLHAEIKYVIHITCDGLRGDFLQDLVNGDPTGVKYPAFRKFLTEGATTFNGRCDYGVSETVQSHVGIVTGRPMDDVTGPGGTTINQTGHFWNTNGLNGTLTIHTMTGASFYKASTFDMAHDRGLSTALYTSKAKLSVISTSYNATNGRADAVGTDEGKNKISVASVADSTGATPKGLLVTDITNGTLRNYTFMHLVDSDSTGHASGWNDAAGAHIAAWDTTVGTIDGYLKNVFDAVTALGAGSPLKNKIALVLTADHGGGGGGTGPGNTNEKNHGDQASIRNFTVPVLMWGPGIPAGKDAHLLFSNRKDAGRDPLTGRPTTATTVVQPLRNLDTGNIAMALLGIPSIDGSVFKPTFADGPTVIQAGVNVVVKWPEYLSGYKLQSTTDLANGPWVDDSAAATDNITYYSRSFSDPAAIDRKRFYRLKGP